MPSVAPAGDRMGRYNSPSQEAWPMGTAWSNPLQLFKRSSFH